MGLPLSSNLLTTGCRVPVRLDIIGTYHSYTTDKHPKQGRAYFATSRRRNQVPNMDIDFIRDRIARLDESAAKSLLLIISLRLAGATNVRFQSVDELAAWVLDIIGRIPDQP